MKATRIARPALPGPLLTPEGWAIGMKAGNCASAATALIALAGVSRPANAAGRTQESIAVLGSLGAAASAPFDTPASLAFARAPANNRTSSSRTWY